MPKGESAVLEPPHLDQLALANEVLEKRREELYVVKIELENVRARISAERTRWSQQQEEEAQQLRLKVQEWDARCRQRISEADQFVRQAELSLTQQKQAEAQAVEEVVKLQAQREALVDLNKERLEVELLKRQVETSRQGIEEREARALQMLNQGSAALDKAAQVQEATENRVLHLNELEATLNQRQEQLVLREKQVQVVMAELDSRLATYAAQQEEQDAESLRRSTESGAGLGEGGIPVEGSSGADRPSSEASGGDDSGRRGGESSDSPESTR